MTMSTCYANYDLSISHGIAPVANQHPPQQSSQILLPPQQQSSRLSSVASAAALVTAAASATASTLVAAASSSLNSQKDYSIPLHVDCSVEYELPNQPKPPAGQRVEPLLMIHPCYFRKMESQRRSPFINNMPSSRNSAAVLAGASQNSTSATSVTTSSRRLATRQHQQPQVLHQSQQQRETKSAQYNIIHHHNQQQQHLRPPQNNSQHMSQMSQQAQYPVATSLSTSVSNDQYIEHASSTRYAAPATTYLHNRSAVTSASHHQKLIHQQHRSHNHQQDLLVQNTPSSAATPWNQLAAVATIVTSITPHHTNIIPPANIPSRNICAVKCCSTNRSMVGKRDAMISGGYTANTNTHSQPSGMNTNANSSCKHINEISVNSHGITTSLIDTTNLRWNAATSLMIERSPIATVPSNYQAGPEATPTIQNTKKSNDNNSNIKNNANRSSKQRQYLRAHRIHPYLATSTSPSSGGSSAVGSINQISQGFAQFRTAIAPATNITLTPSFQQHLQQISLYNV